MEHLTRLTTLLITSQESDSLPTLGLHTRLPPHLVYLSVAKVMDKKPLLGLNCLKHLKVGNWDQLSAV
jgi:hypothetical protein